MQVIQNTDASRFEIKIEDAIAILDYNLSSGLMTITHTFVPQELRGQSIAGKLAKAAFDYAKTEGLKVIPQCSYISVYAQRHPEAAARLVN